jgi:hypothetical protein
MPDNYKPAITGSKRSVIGHPAGGRLLIVPALSQL